MIKALKISGIIFVCVLVVCAIFLAVWFLWPWHSEFYKKASAEFKIPGLESNFVPQAFEKIQNENMYIIGGYMSDGAPSRYYVVNSENGTVVKYFTLKISGKDYVGHACGVASYKEHLWTCSNDGEGGTAYRFLLSDVLTVENGESVTVQDSFLTNNGADNISVNNGYLWVGEFYRKGNYETNENHRIKTRSGEMNTSVAYGFELSNVSENGLVDKLPDKAISMTGLVQGVAFGENGEIILSTSYSLPASTIYCYENVLGQDAHSSISVNGVEVPLWFCDGDSLIKAISAPAMTEEMIVKDGKLYILNESACKKYRLFTRDSVVDVYSLPLDYVVNK